MGLAGEEHKPSRAAAHLPQPILSQHFSPVYHDEAWRCTSWHSRVGMDDQRRVVFEMKGAHRFKVALNAIRQVQQLFANDTAKLLAAVVIKGGKMHFLLRVGHGI